MVRTVKVRSVADRVAVCGTHPSPEIVLIGRKQCILQRFRIDLGRCARFSWTGGDHIMPNGWLRTVLSPFVPLFSSRFHRLHGFLTVSRGPYYDDPYHCFPRVFNGLPLISYYFPNGCTMAFPGSAGAPGPGGPGLPAPPAPGKIRYLGVI